MHLNPAEASSDVRQLLVHRHRLRRLTLLWRVHDRIMLVDNFDLASSASIRGDDFYRLAGLRLHPLAKLDERGIAPQRRLNFIRRFRPVNRSLSLLGEPERFRQPRPQSLCGDICMAALEGLGYEIAGGIRLAVVGFA